MRRVLPVLIAAAVLVGCASSKKYYQQGKYDAAIRLAVKKLRKKPSKEKEIDILEQAYVRANKKDNERLNYLKLEGNPSMWDEVHSRYQSLKRRQTLVEEVLPLEILSTGRLVQFPHVNYDEEIINSKKNAAKYFYEHGVQMLAKGDRENAKKAYHDFEKVKAFYPNYEDVDEKMKDALWMATLKVIAEPIPMHSATFSLSNEFFDNKINEFLGTMPGSKFVRFYTVEEAKVQGVTNPSHIIKIQFDDFVVGQLIIKEKEFQVQKDNVMMGIKDGNQIKTGNDKVKICHVAPNKTPVTQSVAVTGWQAHSKHGDYLGPCSTTPTKDMEIMYGTAKATVTLITRTLLSNGLLDFKIIDFQTNKVLTQEKFPGEFGWTNQYGSFRGDERALSAAQLKAVKNKQLQPPPPQVLFTEFTKPIYNQLTTKIKTFYANY